MKENEEARLAEVHVVHQRETDLLSLSLTVHLNELVKYQSFQLSEEKVSTLHSLNETSVGVIMYTLLQNILKMEVLSKIELA